MIDDGLLWSVALIIAAVALTLAVAPPRTRDRRGLVDAALGPAMIGLLAGRVAAMLLEDPRSISRPTDILVLRGGVELWPAVAVGVTAGLITARRAGRSGTRALADSAPAALVSYAAYEAACLARSGCFGPSNRIGLTPPGLTTPVIPVGLLVAIAMVGVAIAVRRRTLHDSVGGLALAVAGLALVRSVASVWLPKIGTGLTRQHRESVLVLAIALPSIMVQWAYRRRATPIEAIAGT